MTLFAPVRRLRRAATPLAAAAVLSLAGCAATNGPAPVEDRSTGAAAPAPAPKPPEVTYGPDGRALTYVVKPGDTLMRIALDTGQSWRDLARWNKLDNPNLIEVNQVLHIVPPEGEAVATPVAARPSAAVKPIEPPRAAASAPATATATPTPAPPAPAPAPVAASDDLQWSWPATGAVTTPFDETRNKGLAIAGRAGDPIHAAADGRVIYANSGLRGYGNLIIIKHSNNLLSVYAHNQTLLVKEDQVVKRGQKIAEMGSSDADRVQLHFEVRRQGKPINPASVLPSR